MSAERITRAHVEERVADLNRRMAQRGSKVRYATQARNGYLGLDRYHEDGRLLDTVICGTKREVADFLHAGTVVLDDLEFYGSKS
jgi:hypothetical protein